jgi:dTDP-4-dehydrorhamnose 3,5-epimerase
MALQIRVDPCASVVNVVPMNKGAPPPFQAINTGFPGLILLQPRIFKDARGIFVKSFHEDLFHDLGIDFTLREEFYSTSARNVLRGMHFQIPPAAHAKIVCCLQGRVLDVLLDMRRNSPRFGQTFSCELDATRREIFFIPAGFAHGFLSLEDDSLMVYKTDHVHALEQDKGIAWDSFGFKWPLDKPPIMSDRDRQFPRWPDFQSPF